MFQEEEMPEVEIDIDDLLEVSGEDERAVKLQVGRAQALCFALTLTSDSSRLVATHARSTIGRDFYFREKEI